MNKDMTAELTADEVTAEQAGKLKGNVTGTTTTLDVTEGLVNPGFGIDETGKTTTAPVNTLMQSTLELAAGAPLAINRILMNDVRKRMGDVRSSEGVYGAWARYDGGRLSGDNGIETKFSTIQVGGDAYLEPVGARVGAAFSYTDGNEDYARGEGDMKAYSLALYGTWTAENGMFADVIGRVAKVDTDLTVDGDKKGSMDNMAYGLSGEVGWRLGFLDGFYVEPQAELTYTRVSSDDIGISTASYSIDAVDSLLGRVGFAVGMNYPEKAGSFYLRASAVHEFLGDAKITGSNAGVTQAYEIDGKDTWLEFGLGMNVNVTPNTYFWADLERTTGGILEEDWRATVGVRHAWN